MGKNRGALAAPEKLILERYRGFLDELSAIEVAHKDKLRDLEVVREIFRQAVASMSEEEKSSFFLGVLDSMEDMDLHFKDKICKAYDRYIQSLNEKIKTGE